MDVNTTRFFRNPTGIDVLGPNAISNQSEYVADGGGGISC